MSDHMITECSPKKSPMRLDLFALLMYLNCQKIEEERKDERKYPDHQIVWSWY